MFHHDDTPTHSSGIIEAKLYKLRYEFTRLGSVRFFCKMINSVEGGLSEQNY